VVNQIAHTDIYKRSILIVSLIVDLYKCPKHMFLRLLKSHCATTVYDYSTLYTSEYTSVLSIYIIDPAVKKAQEGVESGLAAPIESKILENFGVTQSYAGNCEKCQILCWTI